MPPGLGWHPVTAGARPTQRTQHMAGYGCAWAMGLAKAHAGLGACKGALRARAPRSLQEQST